MKEIGRLREPVASGWDVLSNDYGVAEAEGDVQEIGRQARPLGFTRDPFDRLIVAHALSCDAVLITDDHSPAQALFASVLGLSSLGRAPLSACPL